MAQKGEYHNHSKRGMREGLIKRESQQTKNLVFEPVPRFNFFIVHKKDKFGSFFLSKEIEPDFTILNRNRKCLLLYAYSWIFRHLKPHEQVKSNPFHHVRSHEGVKITVNLRKGCRKMWFSWRKASKFYFFSMTTGVVNIFWFGHTSLLLPLF